MSSKYKLCTIYWINSKKTKNKTTRSMAVELVHWHTCICKFFNKICAVQIFTQILWFWKKKNFDIYKKIPKHLHCIKHKFIHQISFSFLKDTIFFLILKYHFKQKKIQKNIKVIVMLMYHNKFVNIFAIYLQ